MNENDLNVADDVRLIFCLVSKTKWQKALVLLSCYCYFLLVFCDSMKEMCIRIEGVIYLPPYLMHVRSYSDFTLWSGWMAATKNIMEQTNAINASMMAHTFICRDSFLSPSTMAALNKRKDDDDDDDEERMPFTQSNNDSVLNMCALLSFSLVLLDWVLRTSNWIGYTKE